MEMQQQMQEYMMQSRMMEQMELMEEKQERREERNERRQQIREQREREREILGSLTYRNPVQPPPTPQPGHPFIFSPMGSIQTTNAPIQASQLPPMTPTPAHRTSSPIDGNIDDGDVLHQFFEWKILNTRLVERRAKWERARDIVLENDWSIKDLHAMEAGRGAMYDRAITAGITDGLARGFKEELRSFKVVYRRLQVIRDTELAAARSLRDISATIH
jgi:hypothetical protein